MKMTTAVETYKNTNYPVEDDFIEASRLAEDVELDSLFSNLRSRNNLPEKLRDSYIDAYRKWLVLRKLYSRKLTPPNKIIDSMWHEHIIHTEKYFEDCEYLFGCYMHHNPINNPNHPETDKSNVVVGLEAVQGLWSKHFAEEVDYSSGIDCD